MVKVTVTRKDGTSIAIENDTPQTVAEMAKALNLKIDKIAVNGEKADPEAKVPDGAIVSERETAKGV